MSDEPDAKSDGDLVRAMQAERQAGEHVAAARREAADLLTEARRKARQIRARADALVTRMSRMVSERTAREVARIEREHEAELAALETEETPAPHCQDAAASVAAALLGLDRPPPRDRQ